PAHVINWGYWGDVGVVAKAAYRRRMQAMGVHSVSPAIGMHCLETVLANGLAQAMPIKAEQRVLDRKGVVASPDPATTVSMVPGPTGFADTPSGDERRLERAHDRLEALAAAMACRSLQKLGAFRAAGEVRWESTILDELGVS